MIIVGDIICQRRDLGLEAGMGFEFEVTPALIISEGPGQIGFRLPRPEQGAIVLDDTFQGFPGQVEAIELGIAHFQLGDRAQGLGVVIKAAEILHLQGQLTLALMPEGRMPQIMGESERLGQVLIAAQGPRQCPCNLRDFQGMGQTGTVQIALMGHKHLGLSLQPAKGRRVYDSVTIALECIAHGAVSLRKTAPA